MKIAVLSRQPSVHANRRLMEAGAQRGCRVSVLDPLSLPLIYSDGTAGSGQAPATGFDAVIPRFSPTWQRQGRAALMHFERRGVASLNSAKAMSAARDKPYCLELFSAQGIPFPKSAGVESLYAAPDLLAEHFRFPLLIKRNDSTRGLGVERVEDGAQALARIAQLHADEQPFLLQEFIAEAKGEDLRLLVVNGAVIAAMKRTAAPGDFRANIHLGGVARSHDPSAAETAMAIKATALLGLDVAGVDIIPSRRGPLLLEVNACPGFEALERVSGVDVAGKMLDFLISGK